MGYFDKLAENSLKEIDGVTVYYPNGIIGKGRVIPNEEMKIKILNFQKRLYKFLFFVMLPYAYIVGIAHQINITAFSPIILFAIIYYAIQQYHIKDLAIHNSKLAFKDAAQRGANTLPNWYYWMLGILSLGILLLTALLPFIFKKTSFIKLLPLILGLASFGLLGLAVAIKMYKLKNSK